LHVRALPDAYELVNQLEGVVYDLEGRLAAAETRREYEIRRAESAEAALKQASAESERLKREKGPQKKNR
jgi:hypothetical protein